MILVVSDKHPHFKVPGPSLVFEFVPHTRLAVCGKEAGSSLDPVESGMILAARSLSLGAEVGCVCSRAAVVCSLHVCVFACLRVWVFACLRVCVFVFVLCRVVCVPPFVFVS